MIKNLIIFCAESPAAKFENEERTKSANNAQKRSKYCSDFTGLSIVSSPLREDNGDKEKAPPAPEKNGGNEV